MKRILTGLVALAVLTVSSSAFADSSVGNDIQMPGLSFSYQSNTNNGITYFGAYLTNSAQITSAYTSVSHDQNDNLGWVTMSFGGTITPATAIDYQSQSMSVNRHGVSASSYASIASYQQYTSYDPNTGQPIGIGATVSSGNAGVTLQDVTVLSGTANYNEYPEQSGGKGVVMADMPVTPMVSWSAFVRLQVSFNNDTSAALSGSLGSVGVTAPATVATPEPASLGVLGFGALAMLARRRRRRQA